jgi:hypothetical protein
MEIGLILFLALGGYWIIKSIKKNMFDPLERRIQNLENIIQSSKNKVNKKSKYD